MGPEGRAPNATSMIDKIMKTLGLTISPSLRARANQAIE